MPAPEEWPPRPDLRVRAIQNPAYRPAGAVFVSAPGKPWQCQEPGTQHDIDHERRAACNAQSAPQGPVGHSGAAICLTMTYRAPCCSATDICRVSAGRRIRSPGRHCSSGSRHGTGAIPRGGFSILSHMSAPNAVCSRCCLPPMRLRRPEIGIAPGALPAELRPHNCAKAELTGPVFAAVAGCRGAGSRLAPAPCRRDSSIFS
jgi:hypothetical protein